MTNSKQYTIYLMFVTTWSKNLKNMLSLKKNTNGQRSYDYIYMAFIEYTNPERLNETHGWKAQE